MQNLQPQPTTAPTPESVWATFQETDRRLSKMFAETDRKFAETERIFQQNAAAAEKRMKKMEELTGNWANNHGAFAEEYFFNSFEENRRNFFGERFDDIDSQLLRTSLLWYPYLYPFILHKIKQRQLPDFVVFCPNFL
jgi:hypothetical protein